MKLALSTHECIFLATTAIFIFGILWLIVKYLPHQGIKRVAKYLAAICGVVYALLILLAMYNVLKTGANSGIQKEVVLKK